MAGCRDMRPGLGVRQQPPARRHANRVLRSRLRHRALIAVLESSAALKLADYLEQSRAYGQAFPGWAEAERSESERVWTRL